MASKSREADQRRSQRRRCDDLAKSDEYRVRRRKARKRNRPSIGCELV